MKLLFYSWENWTNLSDFFFFFLKTGSTVCLLGKKVANIWISNPSFPFLLYSKSVDGCLLTPTEGLSHTRSGRETEHDQVFHYSVKESSALNAVWCFMLPVLRSSGQSSNRKHEDSWQLLNACPVPSIASALQVINVYVSHCSSVTFHFTDEANEVVEGWATYLRPQS